MIECPICHKKYKSLVTHIFYQHNLTVEKFKELYPNHPLQEFNSSVKGDYECPICHKHFTTKTGLGTHLSYIHKGLKRGENKNKVKHNHINGIKCEICGNIYVNIKQHVERKHKFNWNDYCKKYTYNGLAKYCSEETKKVLSENKKIFYQSEEGLKLKQIQSENMMGDKNFAKKSNIREKISQSRNSQILDGFNGYGLNIWVKYRNDILHLKSFNEFKVFVLLEENNCNFDYEKVRICYQYNNQLKTYITDFLLNKTIYEIKPYSEVKILNGDYDTYEKYQAVKKASENVGYNFKLVNFKMFEKMFNNKHNNQYFKEKMKEMIERGDITKILVNRSKSTFETFIEKEFNYNIVEIRRY